MPSSEYEGWIEYHNRVPFRAEVQEIQLATLAFILYNVNKSEGADDKSITDFMPTQREIIAITKDTAKASTMQSAAETDNINRMMEIFKVKLAQVH
jgi:hypothetical protein